MSYVTMVDEEGVAFASDTIHRFACCDCGLVHDFVLSPSRDRKTVGLAVRRNARATARRRRAIANPPAASAARAYG